MCESQKKEYIQNIYGEFVCYYKPGTVIHNPEHMYKNHYLGIITEIRINPFYTYKVKWLDSKSDWYQYLYVHKHCKVL